MLYGLTAFFNTLCVLDDQGHNEGVKEAKPLAFGLFLIFLPAMNDFVMVVMKLNQGIYLASFGFPLFLFSIAFTLANKFVNVHNQVEELNITLDDKVKDRTAELRETLSEVRALKEQQDGDYFLTSLLLDPLAENKTEVADALMPVNINFLMRQKKKFKFRKWTAEIGGDLCAAHRIELKGRPCTVFINGDAMGKSIQGAGGALVLGVVFKSVVARTKVSGLAKNKYPERWMHECFLELQNVVVGFDGSMLISVFLGIVDELTGLMYFVNAEHPYSVLYRNGKTSFIQKDLQLRKIGVPGEEKHFRVRAMQLQNDDILIVGSDGRDDLQIGEDENGNRIINEDENHFLQIVETGQGDLKRIENALDEAGQITDDLSLIRIGFREDFPLEEDRITEEYHDLVNKGKMALKKNDPINAMTTFKSAYTIYQDDPDLIKEMAQLYLKNKDYENASKFCMKYNDLCPHDNSFLFYSSQSLKKIGDYYQAADYGERLFLRNPGLVDNLVNLADIYRLDGNLERADYLADKALTIDPENNRAKAVKKKITN